MDNATTNTAYDQNTFGSPAEHVVARRDADFTADHSIPGYGDLSKFSADQISEVKKIVHAAVYWSFRRGCTYAYGQQSVGSHSKPAPDASGPIPAVDIYAQDYVDSLSNVLIFQNSITDRLDSSVVRSIKAERREGNIAAFKAGWTKALEPGSTIDNEIDETIDYQYVDHLLKALGLIDDAPARETLLRRLFKSLGVDWPERETSDEKPETGPRPGTEANTEPTERTFTETKLRKWLNYRQAILLGNGAKTDEACYNELQRMRKHLSL